MVEFLLGCGVEVDAESKKGHTALHRAAARGKKEIVRLLLEAGADAGLKDKWGRTAMDAAAAEKQAEVIELLAAQGERKSEILSTKS
jgi:ankyrin repeat protein